MRQFYALVFFLAAVAGLAQPARANGLFENFGVGNGLRNIQQQLNNASRPVPPISPNPPPAIISEKPESKAQMESVYKKLILKPADELAVLAEMKNACTDIDCEGLSADVGTRLVKSALTRRQEHTDAEIRQSQAWAAVGTLGVAFLSLLVSIAGFIRAGRSKKDLTPAPHVAVSPPEKNSPLPKLSPTAG